MKRKHPIIFIMMLLTILSLSACSSQTKDESINLTFSQYYQNADDYDKIYPLLNEYFSGIQNAYDKSDKEDLNTFSLPDNFSEIAKKLSDISNDDSGIRTSDGQLNTSNEYIARLKILEPYLRMEVCLAERNMLSSPNEDWFAKLNNMLSETYMEYETETGE